MLKTASPEPHEQAPLIVSKGGPARKRLSVVRSSTPHAVSSATSRWVVDNGSSDRAAISVSVLRLSSATVSRMALTLLMTERPGVFELPAMCPRSPAAVEEQSSAGAFRRARD
jgi:hypothetical protein